MFVPFREDLNIPPAPNKSPGAPPNAPLFENKNCPPSVFFYQVKARKSLKDVPGWWSIFSVHPRLPSNFHLNLEVRGTCPSLQNISTFNREGTGNPRSEQWTDGLHGI